MPMNRHAISLAVTVAFGAIASFANAADVVIQPASGNGFVVKDAAGANERFRVQESGAVTLPSVASAPTQTQGLCMSASGQLGPCGGGGGGSYTAATGLSLTGTTFSVAPTYQLPQSCTANQIAQWNGTAWTCGSAGGGSLPAGTENQTLRYGAGNALVANNLFQAFADGGLVAGGTPGTGSIPIEGAGARLMWYPTKAAFRAGSVDGTQWDRIYIGVNSVAMGKNTIAEDYSVAMGYGTIAGGTSVAMGDSTQAIGLGSFAIGGSTIASGTYATAMGAGTHATAGRSTAMGDSTTASGGYSTAMGYLSQAKDYYTVAMGFQTVADGTASVAMGDHTIADGKNSTAMGSNVSTNGKNGSFIYGDANGARTVKGLNSADNQFSVIATGGVRFYLSPDYVNQVYINSGDGAWSVTSDRNAKTAIVPVDVRDVLDKVVAMPLNTWRYKSQDAQYRHMGPMAQDFYEAFHLGDSDKAITTIDADGVALAAIQGLNAKLTDKDREIADLRAEVSAQKAENAVKKKQLAEHEAKIAEQRAELAAQKTRVESLESLAAELADVKAQIAALRDSAPRKVAVAWRPH